MAAKRYATVVNGVVTRVSLWDPATAPERATPNKIECPASAGPGWTHDGSQFIDPNPKQKLGFNVEKAQRMHIERINNEYVKLAMGLLATPEEIAEAKVKALAAIEEIKTATNEVEMRTKAEAGHAEVKAASLAVIEGALRK